MLKFRCLLPAGLLIATLVVPLPALGCCRFEMPGGGEVKINGGDVTVTPPSAPPIVPALIQAVVPVAIVPNIAEPVTKVIDDAGKTVGKVATNVVKEGGIGLGNVAREGSIALNNVATTIRKAGSDTGAQLNRSQHDLEDAGTAIYRFTVNQLKGTQTSLSNAEQRFRDGKIVDALFHLSTDPLQNTEQNAANAAQESQLLATVGSVAASVYGGPTGAAAYAAWLTYHQTGDINMALRVGVIAGVSSYAHGQASTMAKTTVTDTMKRAAVVGAIGGAAVAAAGGTPDAINSAFLRGGASILVQDGYKAYTDRDFANELGPATGAARCMAAPVSGGADGCPGPTSFLKDEQGRYVMIDKDGNYHHVEIGEHADIPKDWRLIGDASTTPPGTPVVGIQTDKLPPLSQANEGSTAMVNLAKVPGMNAMALFHDRWAVSWEMDPLTTKATIAPAIVLTYLGATAVVDNASTRAITDAALSSTNASSPGTTTGESAPLSVDSAPSPPATAATAVPGNTAGAAPPTIRQVKPKGAELETLICTRGDSLRTASVIPGKQRGDLQCIIIADMDGKSHAPYFGRTTPGFCARQLIRMSERLTKHGWQCKGR